MLIQFFHVYKSFELGGPALSDLSFEIERGEFVYLTGPSGAGKTTVMRLILAAERPTRGQLLVAGRNVSRLSAREIPNLRRQIGTVFQDFKLLPRRTVYENVAVALEVQGRRGVSADTRVNDILKSVGLAHKRHQLPPTLSGGEQQRVAIARALVGRPTLILADEPTGNLDDERAMEVLDLLRDAHAQGSTVVMATHDRSLIESHPQRCLRLVSGQLQPE